MVATRAGMYELTMNKKNRATLSIGGLSPYLFRVSSV